MRSAIALVLCAVLVLALSGCGVVKTVTATVNPQPAPVKTRTVVVLVDLSGSTGAFRPEYVSDFSALAKTARYGDHWVVYNIDQDTLQRANIIADVTLPIFRAKSDNPAVAANEKSDFEAQNPVSKFVGEITSPTVEALSKQTSKGSDILGGFQLAGRELSMAKTDEAVVAIFSDMQANSKTLDTTKKKFDPASAVATLQQSGNVPELSGARIVVVGAYDKDAAVWQRTRDFWMSFLGAASAKAAPSDYGRRLPSSLLNQLN